MVLVVTLVVVLRVVLAVVLAWELHRPDVAAAAPALPELIPLRTHGIVPRINRLTGRQERHMPIPRPAVILESVEAGIARAVTGEQDDSACGRVTNEIMAEGRDRAATINNPGIRGKQK